MQRVKRLVEDILVISRKGKLEVLAQPSPYIPSDSDEQFPGGDHYNILFWCAARKKNKHADVLLVTIFIDFHGH